jgi:phage terminase small subunit
MLAPIRWSEHMAVAVRSAEKPLIDREHLQTLCAARGLTPKETAFVIAYLFDTGRNGFRAYLMAYKSKGSPRWAVQEASRVLRRPDVRAVICEIEDMVPAVIEGAVAVAGITKARVLLELSHVGLANMADYVDLIRQEGKLDLSQLTRAQTAAIKTLTVETYVEGRGENARPVKRVKLELHDKRQALRTMGTELGMFREKRQIDVTVKDEATRKKGEEARQAMIEHLREFERQKIIEAEAETVALADPAKPPKPRP